MASGGGTNKAIQHALTSLVVTKGMAANMKPTPEEMACWLDQLDRLGEAEVGRRLDATRHQHHKEEFILPGDCGSHPWRGFVADWYRVEEDAKAVVDRQRRPVGTIIVTLGLMAVYLGIAAEGHWWPFR